MAIVKEKNLRPILSREIPPEVREFCAEQGIQAHLKDAISLARKSFRPVRKLQSRLQTDPDDDGSRIIIDVTVDGDIAAVLAMKRDYTARWVKLTPPEVRDQIRLLYHFA